MTNQGKLTEPSVALITRAGGGGVARHVLDLLPLARTHGIRFQVIASALESGFVDAVEGLKNDGVQAHWIDMPRGPNPLADPLVLAKTVSILRAHPVNVLHSHGSKGGMVGRMAAGMLGLPVIHTPHVFPWSWVQSGSRKASAAAVLERLLAKLTDALIALDPVQVKQVEQLRLQPRETVRIANGIDATDARLERVGREMVRREARMELGLPADCQLGVGLGRMAWQKDPVTAVALGAKWLEAFPDLILAWVGEGPLMKEANVAIAAKGHESRWRLPGHVSDPLQWLLAADFYYSTSRYEGMPYSVLEACATGLPLVLSSIDAHKSMTDMSGCALLCNSSSDGEWLAAVRRILGSPEAARTMQAESRACAKRYPLETFREAHLALYRRVAGK